MEGGGKGGCKQVAHWIPYDPLQGGIWLMSYYHLCKCARISWNIAFVTPTKSPWRPDNWGLWVINSYQLWMLYRTNIMHQKDTRTTTPMWHGPCVYIKYVFNRFINSTYLKYTSIMTPIWYCTWITIIYSEESFLQGPTPQVLALHWNCPTGACVTINGEI